VGRLWGQGREGREGEGRRREGEAGGEQGDEAGVCRWQVYAAKMQRRRRGCICHMMLP
jgi:hypothetical protein